MDASWHILRGAVAERSDRDQVWERPGRRAQLAFAIRGITRGPERAQGAAAPGPSARAAGWIGHRDGDRDRGAGVARAAPAGKAAPPDGAACRAGTGGVLGAVPGPSAGTFWRSLVGAGWEGHRSTARRRTCDRRRDASA